jgi:hypothetical protein
MFTRFFTPPRRPKGMTALEANVLRDEITKATGIEAVVTKTADGMIAVLDTSTGLVYGSRLQWVVARAGEQRTLAILERAFAEWKDDEAE